MSKYVEVFALVEGPTEKQFMDKILTPYFARQAIGLHPIIISKPGQKGGDVRFARVKNDIELHLKQRQDTYLTLFIDYYGIKPDWPGYEASLRLPTPGAKADCVNKATKEAVVSLFHECSPDKRFIPYIGLHEFEALLFSDAEILASSLNVNKASVDAILRECGTPEEINNNPNTAPSKRLEALSNQFKKTTTGIGIAESIGIDKIRSKCPLFDSWVRGIEQLKSSI